MGTYFAVFMGWCCGPAFPGTAVVDCETQGRLLVLLRDSILREAQPSCGSAEARDCVSSFVCCCIYFWGGVVSLICPCCVALDERSAMVLSLAPATSFPFPLAPGSVASA